MKVTFAAGALAAATLGSGAFAAPANTAAMSAWQAAIARTPAPRADGCFTAAFPSLQWREVACKTAPNRPYLPRAGLPGGLGNTVGNGHDYTADTSNITQSATGSFPTVRGVRRESDGGANIYSIQLNSGFMNTSGCNGGASGCLTWEQFVYSSSSFAAFIQYWLINYGNRCPDSSWNPYQGSCYKNSRAVSTPKFSITQLGNIQLSGSAVAGGNDTLRLINGGNAYTTGGNDNVLGLAQGWTSSEFNVIGDGGGSRANFNTGSSITVQINPNDGSGQAPACTADNGTTGETNNLNLRGSCSTFAGGNPGISFTESN